MKEVCLTDEAKYGCTINPVNGDFLIDIRGRVSNIQDFSIPDDLKRVSSFVSGRMFVALLCQDAFSEFRNFMEKKHPEMFKVKRKSKSKR